MNSLINNMLEKKKKEDLITKLDKNRRDYVQPWEASSKYYFEQGYYDWMEAQITQFDILLEIGCGVGFSTLTLVDKGHKVITIEENSYCLDRTESLLVAKGFTVKVIREREKVTPLNELRYEVLYKAIAEDIKINKFDAVLIQGDIINDSSLISWLKSNDEFRINGVICWLLGTHYSRGNNIIFDLEKVNTPGLARLITQNKIYDLCDDILAFGGCLHIVDRSIEHKSTDIQKAVKEQHDDQASVTKMEIKNITVTTYQEPEGEKMKMVNSTFNPEAKEIAVNPNKRIFVSILSIKQ